MTTSRWAFILDEDTNAVELAAATSRQGQWLVNQPALGSFKIDGRHPESASIRELITDLSIYRAGVRLYRGRVASATDDVNEEQHIVDVMSGDYRAVLDRRITYDADTLSFSITDVGAIFAGLVTATQIRTNGALGINSGHGISTGNVVSLDLDPGMRISYIGNFLGTLGTGYEWEIDGDRQLNLYTPTQGQDRAVVLQYGGLVKSFRRTPDPSNYANAIRLTGTDVLDAEERTQTDIATRPEGRWELQRGFTEINEQVTLDSRADFLINDLSAELDPDALDSAVVVPVAYELNLVQGAWEGPDHIWKGDTVRFVARSGRLDIDASYRVMGITAGPTGDGTEDVTLTLGALTVQQQKALGDLYKRLENLERR